VKSSKFTVLYFFLFAKAASFYTQWIRDSDCAESGLCGVLTGRIQTVRNP